MKILYTANERHDAQLAANALRSLAPDATVAWAGRLSDAQLWVSENRDLTAVVVEAQVHNQSCASFVGHIRSLGLTTPILVVAPENAGVPLAALKAGANDYVLKNQSLFPNLTAIVSRTLRPAQARSCPLRLLYVGDAALARECLESDRCPIEITEAVPDANGRFWPIPFESASAEKPFPFDVLLIEHDHPGVDAFAILKHVVVRQLPVPVIFVVERDEQLFIPALKLRAADYVVKARDAFRALLVRLDQRYPERVHGTHSAPQQRDPQAASLETELRLNALSHAQQTSESQDRLAELAAAKVEGAAIRASLEQRLADAQTALQEAEERLAVEQAAGQQISKRQALFEARLNLEVDQRNALAKKLATADVALHDAERRHATEMTAAADRLSERQSQYDDALVQLAQRDEAFTTRLTQVVRSRDTLEKQLHDAAETRQTLEVKLAHADTMLREAEDRHAWAMTTAAGQLSEQQARYEGRLAETAATLQMLERRLADAEGALQNTEQRATADRLAAEQQAAQRQAEFEARLGQEAANREALEQALTAARRKAAETQSALRDAEQRHTSNMTAANARFADQLGQHEARLAQAEASLERSQQERAVDAAAANTAMQVAEQRAAAEQLAAGQQAAQRQAEFEARLDQEAANREALEQALTAARRKGAETESALRDAEQRHTSNVTAANARFADQLGQHEARLAQAEASLERSQQERAVEAAAADTARQVAEQRATADRLAAEQQAAQRQAEFEARLDQEAANREALEQALTAARRKAAETESALRDAEQRHTSNMTAANARFVDQLGQHEARLAQAAVALDVADQQLRKAEASLERSQQERAVDAAAANTAMKVAEQRAAAEQLAAGQQAAQRQAEFEAAMAREIAGRRVVEQDLATSRQELAARESALRDAERRHASVMRSAAKEAIAAAERLTQLETELAKATANSETLERRLADVTSAFHTAEQLVVSERLASAQQARQRQVEFDAQLNQRESELAVASTARQALVQLLDESAVLMAGMREIEAGLNEQLGRERAEYQAKLVRVEALVAERDGQMKEQAARHATSEQAAQQALAKLESELRAENRRQFDQSPVGILRCSHAGALQEANDALISALGYRTVDELRALDLAASVFESADDFRWLIENCQRTPTESVDRTWKKKDGSRLIMRLRAVQLSANAVEIVAEDLTSLRSVEERLRQAHRMEAVGRLASEVAVTCDSLLRNVSQDGQQWLATVGGNPAQRHQGELIFGEVTRAASFLRQLSVYGDEQTRALAPVDVNRVLRELEPVLKRVAGDDIELVLPKRVAALNVDVDSDYVERLLVNVAAYGRARMPTGGRLIVELARVAVDRNFVTKHPNVRQGAHALIRVTEVKAATRADGPLGIRKPSGVAASRPTSERPGVDLGALQALIGDCGGHLWMKAEPGGDMEVKIHLPLRPADAPQRAKVARSGRGGSVGRWFQS